MKRIVNKYWKTALFTLAGAGIGFAYWRFIGCTSGTCPLTANWHTSMLFGGLIGMLAVSSKDKSSKEVVSSPGSETGSPPMDAGQSDSPDQTEK